MVHSVVSLSSLCLPFFLLFFCFSSPTASAIIRNNETDKLSLLEFKSKITYDPFGVMTSWNSSLHFCQWHGITCGRRHQRVTVLDLQSLELSGTVPPFIANLSFLRVLNLQNNSFIDQIPPQIGYLNRLRILYLSNNSMTGQIPRTISNCSNLLAVYLSYNKLDGEIPVGFGSLMKLKRLYLMNNRLVGIIPPSLGNLSSLEQLHLYYNNLDGVIPATLGQLTNLWHLGLYRNAFSGEFPSLMFNLSLIQRFDVSSNYLKGNLPQGIGTSLPNLQFFSIASNQFSGTIPSSFFNASNLHVLQLVYNNLTGPVPSLSKLNSLRVLLADANYLGSGENDDLEFLSSLSNATHLEYLGIGSNNLRGKLPHSVSNFSTLLKRFIIRDNQIFGNIPDGISALVNLQQLGVGSNQLSGPIPCSIGKLQNLQVFNFESNYFSASIPSTLGNLTNLIKLVLSFNNFHGIIPTTLGNCKNLLQLDLSENNLSGTIPPQIFDISSLSILLDLSKNQLSGSLPNEVGNLKNLGALLLHENKLSGEIPTSLGSCTRLEFLYMGANLFRGSIPSSLSALRGLQKFNLSHNNLSGQIPEFLKGFELMLLLDLSYNDLEGMVPTDGIFKNANATFVVGNENLCGGVPALKLPPCKFGKDDKKLTLKLKIIISLASLASGGFFLIFLFLWRSTRRKVEIASRWDENSLLQLSYQRLLKATNGFSSDNLIGAGSFGSVYKGILDHKEGRVIAVKVLNVLHPGASKSFIAECEALKNIRHRNLVKVITACSSTDYSGKDFKALVYEFMVNGSLDNWLHPTIAADQIPRTLSFLQRLNIAIDVASALEYLHHQCETPIAHCDLKPSNILLDKEMTAHVSDFGLSKFLYGQIAETSANETSSVGVRGTIGYCPPEYGVGSKVSAVGDIFSYGIILLEMFSGKRPIDEMFNDSINLHGLVKRALPNTVLEIVDPNLLQADQYWNFKNTKDNNTVIECLISIFEIGLLCSVESPQETNGNWKCYCSTNLY